jgi:hypothetical protein
MSALVYPQLAQYPVVTRRQTRTVANRMADGSAIRMADPAGVRIQWDLHYGELSDTEIGALQEFFAAAEGRLNGFTFLDPEANLLAYSGMLDNRVWAVEPGLSATAGEGFYTLRNTAAAAQSITQELGAAPADYVYSLSAEVRSATGAITLLVGSRKAQRAAGADWRRIVFAAAADVATFGLEVPAGASVDVIGMQVEAQPGASAYRATTVGGVYEGARLGDDGLEFVTVGPNRHACRVSVVYNGHV